LDRVTQNGPMDNSAHPRTDRRAGRKHNVSAHKVAGITIGQRLTLPWAESDLRIWGIGSREMWAAA